LVIARMTWHEVPAANSPPGPSCGIKRGIDRALAPACDLVLAEQLAQIATPNFVWPPAAVPGRFRDRLSPVRSARMHLAGLPTRCAKT
jgi:hypothetical protein